jgi:hypothetical protein
MDAKTAERYGALGGIWFVILAVIGGMLAGSSMPGRDDPVSEIVEFYADNDGAIQLGAFLTAIGVIGLVWWFGSLWRKMTDAEGGTPRLAVVALLGLTLSGIGAMTGMIINAGTAATIDVAGEGSAAFFAMSSVAFAFSGVGDVVLTLAVAVLILRSDMLPKWVAYASLVSAAVSLVAALGIASDADFFVVLGFIAFLVWSAWVLLLSVLLYQQTPTSAASA